MKNVQSYNKELEIATAQFKDVLNNIKVFIFNRDNTVRREIKVPMRYAAKSVALKELEDRKKNPALPIMAFSRTGFNVDPERFFNINQDILMQADAGIDYTLMQPVPIDIQFELNVFSMNPREDEQILQNFIPFSAPGFYVAWKHPYTEGTLKSQVIWDGQIGTEYASIDYDGESKQRITSSTTFIYKTWIFPGSALGDGNGRLERTDDIYTVITDFYADEDPAALYDFLYSDGDNLIDADDEIVTDGDDENIETND